ncbi:Hypothetical predicted protein [Paramuricea clavata]|uniref:Uncharacterized protein n=1 Tax=Paramuricea clavata TaxID=317549 RepID=A0A6S7K709_PARCT|nr:Hypothetical predicted protein [Paramuricea clavata]
MTAAATTRDRNFTLVQRDVVESELVGFPCYEIQHQLVESTVDIDATLEDEESLDHYDQPREDELSALLSNDLSVPYIPTVNSETTAETELENGCQNQPLPTAGENETNEENEWVLDYLDRIQDEMVHAEKEMEEQDDDDEPWRQHKIKKHTLEHSLQVFTKMWRYVVRSQQDNQERRPTSTTAAETCAQVCDESTSLSSSTNSTPIQQCQQLMHGDEGAQDTEQQPNEINDELQTAEMQQQTHKTIEA